MYVSSLFLDSTCYFVTCMYVPIFFRIRFVLKVFSSILHVFFFLLPVVRRKTIYEYHRVSMKNQEIANQTAIYLQALPRCNMKTSCEECIALNVTEEEDRVVPVSLRFLFFRQINLVVAVPYFEILRKNN